ncbi:hypothetical protein [Niveispirillum sp. BGYR6]|uniref:hypothetical protein n=1 Tax=Niveispirillum sp. BGYR6 TaxID=2971249 RepID=UPI0022B9A4FD|nr:hypothetical protein [Niveispirillum sp. BGYR6]MDG5494108.1 hypothetical protein [Niveispirillum sp. BGYR6]
MFKIVDPRKVRIFRPYGENVDPWFKIIDEEIYIPGKNGPISYSIEKIDCKETIDKVELNNWNDVSRYFDRIGCGDQFKSEFPGVHYINLGD